VGSGVAMEIPLVDVDVGVSVNVNVDDDMAVVVDGFVVVVIEPVNAIRFT